jgi:hypothetical protein
MKLCIDGKPIAPKLVTYNSGLNYGRFDRGEGLEVHAYELTLEKSELVESFAAQYAAVSEEIRRDDELVSDWSQFKGMGYVSLAEAFAFPELLAKAITVYFDRDILETCLPRPNDPQYVINSTDRVSVLPARIILEGRCFVPRRPSDPALGSTRIGTD